MISDGSDDSSTDHYTIKDTQRNVRSVGTRIDAGRAAARSAASAAPPVKREEPSGQLPAAPEKHQQTEYSHSHSNSHSHSPSYSHSHLMTRKEIFRER